MRRAFWRGAALLLALALAVSGCGTRAPDSPAAPGRSPSGSTPTGVVDFELVAILTGVSAGGTVDPAPSPLRTDDEVSQFVAQFRRSGLAAQIRSQVARTDVTDGRALVGAVVALGCEVPVEVSVVRVGGRLAVQPVPTGSSPVECFAAMTSVALVLVEESLVGATLPEG